MNADNDSQRNAAAGELERLLNLSTRAARSGNRVAARKLLTAITREYPQEARAWLWLAGVAENTTEQRQALERVIELDPGNPLAQQRLEQLRSREEYAAPVAFTPPGNVAVPEKRPRDPRPTTAAADYSYPRPEAGEGNNRFFFIIVGLLLAAIAGTLVYQGLNSNGGSVALQPTPPLSQLELSPQSLPTQAADLPVATAVVPPVVPPTAVAEQGSGAVEVPGEATAVVTDDVPTSTVPASAAAELPMGALREYDGWQATLLRPDYALVLDGAIGELQPQGRFVLALVSISNNTGAARRIPPDMFTLVDAQGRSHLPVPNASATYLNVYGRGQRGDLAFEDEISPDGGLVSVPLIFDVPPDASELRLAMGSLASGAWPVVASSDPGSMAPTPVPEAAP